MSDDHNEFGDGIEPGRRGLLKTMGLAALGGTGSFSGITAGESAIQRGSSGLQSGVANGEWVEQTKLTASDEASSSGFGEEVALDGNTALITGGSEGPIAVFTRSDGSWSKQTNLSPSNGGSRVALDGNTAIIGEPVLNLTAWVYTRTGGTWEKQAELRPSDSGGRDHFGEAIAIDENTAFIGAPGQYLEGVAYIYTRSNGTWSEELKLQPSDLTEANGFGMTISLDGDVAIIGAPGDRDSAGSAYVFARSNGKWARQAKLTPNETDSRYEFGTSVAIDGDTALVGVNLLVEGDPAAAPVFVFTRTDGTWSQEQKLTPSNVDNDEYFGISVAIEGDTALIGSLRDEDLTNGSSGPGITYVYTRSNGSWSEQTILAASDGHSDNHFGESVALNNDTALIGAPRNKGPDGEAAGSGYVFKYLSESMEFSPTVHAFGFENWGTGPQSKFPDHEHAKVSQDEINTTINQTWGSELQDQLNIDIASVPDMIINTIVKEIYTTVNQGSATDGHCLGMVFAAREYFENPERIPVNRPTASSINSPTIPETTTQEPVGDDIDLYQNKQSTDFATWAAVRLISSPEIGPAKINYNNVISNLKSDIEEYGTAPIALGNSSGGGHQVLAYDYDEIGNDIIFRIYNPNNSADNLSPETVSFDKSQSNPELKSGLGYDKAVYVGGSQNNDLEVLFYAGVEELADLLIGGIVSFFTKSPVSIEVRGPDGKMLPGNRSEFTNDNLTEFEDIRYRYGAPSGKYSITLEGESTGEYTLQAQGQARNGGLIDVSYTDTISQGESHSFEATLPDSKDDSGTILSPVVGSSPPTDPDGDGLYEDVNGDGDANVGDAQTLFSNKDSEPVQDHMELFDFNSDQSLNVGDAQALFDEVTKD